MRNWPVLALYVMVVIIMFVTIVALRANKAPRGVSYEIGTIASVVSAGEDPDGTFKVRISRGGADLQVLDTGIDDATWNNLQKIRPGDKMIFCFGVWNRVKSVVEVVEGDFNGFHEGDRVAITRQGPVLVKYWDPTKDEE